jgi:hypothetical protein
MSDCGKIDLGDGHVALIVEDQDAPQPYGEDSSTRIVVLHRRCSDPAGGACGKTPAEVEAWVERHPAWYSIPLWRHDDFGTVYKVSERNPFTRPWDSGRVGVIALRRRDWCGKHATAEQFHRAAELVAEQYTLWAIGECYGYVIQDAAGNEVDSCRGLIGHEEACDAAREAWTARKARIEGE